MKPLVSVVIPCYSEQTKYLKRANDSVNKQTYPNIELIIIDDDDLTSPEARNKGVKQSKGLFIAFLDADDEWIPTKIEKQMEVMNKHPGCSLVVCWALDKRFDRLRINKPKNNASRQDIIDAFNYSSTSAYLVRKSTFESVDGFDSCLPSAQEYDLAIRFADNGEKTRCVEEVLMIQNATKGQISENWSKKIKGIKALRKKGYWKGINRIKSYGLNTLYRVGFIFGNRIYLIGDYMRGRHE